MEIGKTVSIHTYDRAWEDAQIIGVGDDNLVGDRQVFIVRHPHFQSDLDFYQDADSTGKHYNVGNGAYWIEQA